MPIDGGARQNRVRRIWLWRQIAPDLPQMADRRHAAATSPLVNQGEDTSAHLLEGDVERTRVARASLYRPGERCAKEIVLGRAFC